MVTPALSFQTPSLVRALRLSYGVTASPSAAARASALAPGIRSTHTGVYQVGACTVDLWRNACTCAPARNRKATGRTWQPCAHFLALYLAMEWIPADPDPCAYLRAAGIEQPEIIMFRARVRGRQGVYTLGESFRLATGGIAWYTLYQAGREVGAAPLCDLIHLQPVYEEMGS